MNHKPYARKRKLKAPDRHDRHLMHLINHRGRYACGVGKGGLYTEDYTQVTCEKCKQSVAYKKAQKNYIPQSLEII